jgi:hypothetical protein
MGRPEGRLEGSCDAKKGRRTGENGDDEWGKIVEPAREVSYTVYN